MVARHLWLIKPAACLTFEDDWDLILINKCCRISMSYRTFEARQSSMLSGQNAFGKFSGQYQLH